MSELRRRLILFARYPIAGKAKPPLPPKALENRFAEGPVNFGFQYRLEHEEFTAAPTDGLRSFNGGGGLFELVTGHWVIRVHSKRL